MIEHSSIVMDAQSDSSSQEVRHIRDVLQRLFPIMRSITGGGVRKSLDILSEIVPLERIEVPSGTQVLDWIVPKEWQFREAYIADLNGKKVVDAAEHNLHVVNYSRPYRGRISKRELDSHLHSRPDLPEAIPYVTSYYRETWGFCLSERARLQLSESEYDAVIDTALIDGALSLGHVVLPGASGREILFSTYVCHPSMINDEIAAAVALAKLASRISRWPSRRHSYRFVFLPETIGSIAYLHLYGSELKERVVAGYTVANIARDEPFRYKRSRREDTLADRAAVELLKQHSDATSIKPFEPLGSDERQYCSPGFDMPVGAITRSEPDFEEYHTSLDNLDRASCAAVAETVDVLEQLCAILEHNLTYRNLAPWGEPNLGRRGLYPSLGGENHKEQDVNTRLWFLNQADGTRDLLTIAERSSIRFEDLHAAATDCLAAGLVEIVEEE